MENTIFIDGQFFEFYSAEGQQSFYMFDLTSTSPCYGTMFQPKLESELSYPFLNKPYIVNHFFNERDVLPLDKWMGNP